MKTQSDKERRREKHKRERKLNTSTLNLNPRLMVRCPGCGGVVKMPCHKCYVDSLKEAK